MRTVGYTWRIDMNNSEFLDMLKVTGELTDKILGHYIIINNNVIALIENSSIDIRDDYKQLKKLGLPVEEILYFIGVVLIKRRISNDIKETIYKHLKLVNETVIFTQHQWIPCIDTIIDVLDTYYTDEDKKAHIQVISIGDLGFDVLKLRLKGEIYEIVLNFNEQKGIKEYNLRKNGIVTNSNVSVVRIIDRNRFKAYNKNISIRKYKDNLILM